VAIEPTTEPPLMLLADHVDGERPILAYQVADLGATLADGRPGWEHPDLRDPPRAVVLVRTPGGHRIALYELTRLEVVTHFDGRRDS
jgi:hypothetical protein